MLLAGKTGDALDVFTSDSTVAAFNGSLAAANDDTQFNAKAALVDVDKTSAALNHASWISSTATPLIVLLCAVIGFFLTRVIAPPLKTVTLALEHLAEKDLTVSVEELGHDEIGRLSAALNSSVASIRSVMQSFAKGAETLSAATTEISARAVQSAGNAHAQSSKTNQIAAAAQEMTATIGEISHNAESPLKPAANRRRWPTRAAR